MTTPDIEGDVIARLVQLRPLVFWATSGKRNVWPGMEQPPGGLVGVEATFVNVFAERQRIHSGGQWREVDVQVLRRYARGGERMRFDDGSYAAALEQARDDYDALHLSGPFTGDSGATYLDVRALGAPIHLEPAYFALNFTFWLDA